MMEWSLGKDSRLIFCCVLHFKNLNLSIRIVGRTIREETPVAFAIYSELERTFCKVSIAWQTLSVKAGQLTENVRDTEGSAKCNRRVYCYCTACCESTLGV